MYAILVDLLLFFFLFLFSTSPLSANNSGGSGDSFLVDKVIASVDKEYILYSELERYYKMYLLQNPSANSLGEGVKLELLAQLIKQKLYLAYAERVGAPISDAYIKQCSAMQIDQWVGHFGSEDKLCAYFNMPYHLIKKEIKHNIRQSESVKYVNQRIVEGIAITPQEVRDAFNKLAHVPSCPTEVEVYQLVVYPTVDVNLQRKAKEKLQALKKQIDQGQTFSELQELYKDKVPYLVGDQERWVRFGSKHPSYEAALMIMHKGQISDPVLVDGSLYLIELIDKDKKKYKSRFIAYRLMPTAKDLEAASVRIADIYRTILEGTLSFDQAVQKYTEDEMARYTGGMILPVAPPEAAQHELGYSEKSILHLDKDTLGWVSGMKEGDLVNAGTFYGKRQGYRLLYLKKKTDVHRMNLEQDYDKISGYFLEQKKQKKINAWVKTILPGFVIDVDQAYRQVIPLLYR